MPRVYGHRACKSLVEVAAKDHTHTADEVGAAKKSAAETVIVTASSWVGEIAPYTAVVSSELAAADNYLIVGAGNTLNSEQQAAMAAAMIMCTAQAAGYITLTAYGSKPSIALPVNIMRVG